LGEINNGEMLEKSAVETQIHKGNGEASNHRTLAFWVKALLRIDIQFMKRMLKLKENEVFRGCDGTVYYTATRQGDHIVIAEDPRCRYCGNMTPYGNEGSMKCLHGMKRSDEDAKNCKRFFWFTEAKK